MNLYHWQKATCIKEYADGDIIVMALSVDEARQKALANITDYLRHQRRSWWFREDGSVHPDDKEDYDAFIRTLETDLANEPDIITEGTIFIRGSE